MLAVPLPAKVTFVPSHTSDVGVVFVALDGLSFTVKLASAVVAEHAPLADTVYVIVAVSSELILPVT